MNVLPGYMKLNVSYKQKAFNNKEKKKKKRCKRLVQKLMKV